MFSKAIVLAAVAAFTTSVVAKTGDMTFFTPVSLSRLLKLILHNLLRISLLTYLYHRALEPVAASTTRALQLSLLTQWTTPMVPTAEDGSPFREMAARQPHELLICALAAPMETSMSPQLSSTTLLPWMWVGLGLTGSSSR